jgi:HK97 gp10 family phage protein
MAVNYTHEKGKNLKMVVTGIKEVDDKFNKMQHKMRVSLGKKALRQAAKAELAFAKMMVPVDSGKLRKSLSVNSMRVSRSARQQGIFGFKVAPRKSRRAEVPYIRVVEEGEYKGSRSGTFFLKRSAVAAMPRVKQIFASELKRLVTESEETGKA